MIIDYIVPAFKWMCSPEAANIGKLLTGISAIMIYFLLRDYRKWLL